MSLRDFLSKQFIDVIDWVEPEDGILAYRYPMQDREIQNGGKLTVRDSQFAVFVNEGKVADAFRPRPLHAEHANAADPHLPQELGQSLPVAVQIRRLLFLRAHANRSALGHSESHHHSRQGIRRHSPARVRHLFLSPGRCEKRFTAKSAAPAISIASPISKASSATPSSRK